MPEEVRLILYHTPVSFPMAFSVNSIELAASSVVFLDHASS